MLLRFQIEECKVQAAWLKTLYDMIEELNCKCNTYLEETKYSPYKNFSRTRVVEVYGSETMINWLKLRMETYIHFVNSLNSKPEITIISE